MPVNGMRSSVALETELQGLSDEDLVQMKHEIEVRLARFQKAFLEHHGRNPDEAERAPAKPAIKRYRAVCKELSIREQEYKYQEERQYQSHAAHKVGNRPHAGNMAEMAAGQAQVVSATDDAGGEEEDEKGQGTKGATRASCARAAANVDVTSSAAASSSMSALSSSAPSAGTWEILFNGIQYMQARARRRRPSAPAARAPVGAPPLSLPPRARLLLSRPPPHARAGRGDDAGVGLAADARAGRRVGARLVGRWLPEGLRVRTISIACYAMLCYAMRTIAASPHLASPSDDLLVLPGGWSSSTSTSTCWASTLPD